METHVPRGPVAFLAARPIGSLLSTGRGESGHSVSRSREGSDSAGTQGAEGSGGRWMIVGRVEEGGAETFEIPRTSLALARARPLSAEDTIQ